MYRTYNSDCSSRLDRKIDSARYVILCYVIHQILATQQQGVVSSAYRAQFEICENSEEIRRKSSSPRKAATREWLLELMTVTSRGWWRHGCDGRAAGGRRRRDDVLSLIYQSIRSTNGNTMSAIIDTHYNNFYCLHREYEQYITGRTLRLF